MKSSRSAVCLAIFLLASCASGSKFAGGASSSHGHLSEAEQSDGRRLNALAMAASQEVKEVHALARVFFHLDEASKPQTVAGSADETLASRQELFFRPVSTTLYCVMFLTIQSLLIYTALAVSRNKDELSGELKTSKLTDILSTASRSSVFSSMMSMLFVSCRMYVLATTEGLGEPPPWVKASMTAATVGMTLQLVLVLVMPLLIKEDTTGSAKAFSELSGGEWDAHPKIEPHDFHDSITRRVVWSLQFAAMAILYGGTLGVFVGVATFPAQTTELSAAVKCTCWLSLLYFAVYFMLWCTRVNRDRIEEEMQESGTSVQEGDDLFVAQRSEAALLAASGAVRKAPMLAVLFLAARMRALQLDPPQGMPPPWAQSCFYGMTLALLLETLCAACVGATGKEQTGYYGCHVFTAKPAVHAAQHACAACVYVALVPIVAAVYLMPGKSGELAPLSATMNCVLLLGLLYFGVCIGQWITFFAQDVLIKPSKVAQDTFLAAGVSTTCLPLLAILFVATRMRALQITQQLGAPQGWAEDGMRLCVFAAYVQVLTCILLPIFTNAATEVDGDGNASYDLRPMVGAYAVTAVKYVALFCLHGGVLVICVAVFTMTPETAHTDMTMPFSTKELLEWLCITLLITLVALLLSSAKVIGLAIKLAIESADKAILGTDVWVGRAALSVCDGYVNVAGLVVENPPSKDGHTWKSDCLMKVDKLVLKVDIWRLVKSMGTELQIRTIILEGLQVTLDKSYGKQSNVREILAHLESLGVGGKDESKPKEEAPPPPPSNNLDAVMPGPEVIVNHVSIREIGASAILQGTPFTVQVADIVFEDLQERLEKKSSANIAGDIIALVLLTICKSIVKNTPFVSAAVQASKEKVVETGSMVMERGKRLFQSS
eukprot:TRINITY_DN35117_c0_g1_i1.p1 TRINITY_DN35117_c0_g1~~TRINITY_DN35117_c0_g1_i1.p1  ORF type:complete len:889 (-),score=194.68 TRINITY_DN35117_c0_g1_i1:91-2757(-)